jgi:putative membrane protein
MIKAENFFSEQDKQRIAEAVREAETRTSGEIVPYVVGRSDSYPETWLRAGSLLAFFVLFVIALMDLGTDWWLPFSLAETGMIVVMAYAVGGLLTTFIPAVKRLVLPAGTMQQRIEDRAEIAFLEEEVFNTRERTGILIFISLLEHRVHILGDSGINKLVKQEEWDTIVQNIIAAIRRGVPAEGVLDAVKQCGTLLERSGVEIRPDDTNELDNRVRISDT